MKNMNITPEELFISRRKFLGSALHAGLLGTLPFSSYAFGSMSGLVLTDEKKATRYNNYYEFTTNKKHVHIIAAEFTPKPWELDVGGFDRLLSNAAGNCNLILLSIHTFLQVKYQVCALQDHL